MWAIIISNLMTGFIRFSIFVWSIFMPHAGGYTYLAIYIAFQSYLFFIDSSNKPSPDPEIWSPDEIEILRKYHLTLRFPFGSEDMSCHLNRFRWIGLLLLTPLVLWNHMWIVAVILIASFFISGSISVRLDPIFFLGDTVNRGKLQFTSELELLNRVSERLRERMKTQNNLPTIKSSGRLTAAADQRVRDQKI